MADKPREITPAMETSQLARLPREIRDEIYTYTLTIPHPIKIHIGSAKPTLRSPESSHHPLALTQTCTQIRRECAALFYFLNTFTLTTSLPAHQNITQITSWLDQIGTVNASALRNGNVEIDLGPWTPGYVPPSSASQHTVPLPTQAAAYITCFRTLNIPIVFSIDVRYSDIPGLGRFELQSLDLLAEERLFATRDSVFERACLRQARRIEDLSAESRIESYAVIRLLMGLDRCRRSFGEFLEVVVREVEVQRAIQAARGGTGGG